MDDELKKIWKVFVRRNLLTKDTDTTKGSVKAKDEEKKVSYYGVVDTSKETLTNAGISTRIVAERPGFKKEVVDSVLGMRDGIVIAAIENGERVQDGVVHIAPVSRGSWPSKDHVSDPSKQKADISVTPVAAVRARLNAIHLSVCGEKDDGAFIGCVYALPKAVKTNTLKPGDEVLVTGEKMRVAPEDEEGLGVLLTDSQNVDWTLDHYLIENKSKRLVFRVPELPPETYTLKVITRFSNSNKTFLKAPRVLVYDEPLSVLPPVPPVPPNKKAATEKKPAVKKAAEKKAVGKKAAEKKAAVKKAADKKATVKKAAVKKAATEKKAGKKAAAEKKAAVKKAAGKKASTEKKPAAKKAAEKKADGKKAATEKKAAEKKAVSGKKPAVKKAVGKK